MKNFNVSSTFVMIADKFVADHKDDFRTDLKGLTPSTSFVTTASLITEGAKLCNSLNELAYIIHNMGLQVPIPSYINVIMESEDSDLITIEFARFDFVITKELLLEFKGVLKPVERMPEKMALYVSENSREALGKMNDAMHSTVIFSTKTAAEIAEMLNIVRTHAVKVWDGVTCSDGCEPTLHAIREVISAYGIAMKVKSTTFHNFEIVFSYGGVSGQLRLPMIHNVL